MRHVTYRGRIVYDRAKHLFNESDLSRIGSRIIENSEDDLPVIVKIIQRVTINLMKIILERFGASEAADALYHFCLGIIEWLLATLGHLAYDVGLRWGEKFSQEIASNYDRYLDELLKDQPTGL